jgi:hypothetical protein
MSELMSGDQDSLLTLPYIKRNIIMVSPLVRLFILSQQHSNRGDTKLQSPDEDMAAFFNDCLYEIQK